jgi:hypothetical protein
MADRPSHRAVGTAGVSIGGYASMPDQRPIPIVDARQHFWDLEANYLPWLRDEPLIPFRYGDYTAIRRNYLPEPQA